MALGTDYAQQQCCIARALEVVGERWSLLILRDAFYGVRRFNDFLAHLGLPRAVLTARLRSLTEAGVLRREEYQSAPARHHYVLTEAGQELWPVIYGLAQWGLHNAGGQGQMVDYTHTACGAALDRTGACPACGGEPLPPAEITMCPRPEAHWELRPDPVSRAMTGPRPLLTPVRTDADAAS